MTAPSRHSDTGGPQPALRPPAFVGRERELAALTQALAHPPAVVLLEGEAGIGKSRLLQEVLRSPVAMQERVLVAACPPFREPHTLGPVVDAIRQSTDQVTELRLSPLAGALRSLFPEWSADLAPALEPAEDATAARHRLFRALNELLDALRVATLVVEDAHWADDATIEFLLFLVARRPPRVSVVITYRPEDLAEDSLLRRLGSRVSPGFAHARVTLEPLAIGDTVALVSSMLQDEPLSDAFAALVQEGTDGIPLAVEESVRLMIDRADLVLRSDGWARRRLEAIAIPPTVRDAVLERVRRLEPDAQAMLQAVAVFAEPTDATTVVTVSGLPSGSALTGLEQALRCRLVVEDGRGRIAFQHTLAGRAVYDGTPTRQRREIHLRAARALEAVAPPSFARLARHFREAGEQAEWSRYAEQAADQAMAVGDEALAASTLYDLMVTVEQTPSALLRLINKLPVISPLGHGELQRLAHTLESIVDRATATPSETARLRVQLGRTLLLLQAYESARVELEHAVAEPELEPIDKARAMNLLGWPLEPSQPASAHRRWLERADKELDAVEPPQRQRLGVDRATALLLLGDDAGWVAAAVLDEQSAGLLPSLRVGRDLNVGDMATMWGRFGEARRRLVQALALADEHQYLRLQAMALGNLACLDWFSGTWSGLHERANDVANHESAPPVSRLEARLVLGLLASVTASDIDPHDELQSVFAASQPLDPRLAMASAGALARLLLDDGDVTGALTVTDEPIDMLTRKGVWIWATDLGPARVAALLAADRVSDAEALTANFGHGLQGRGAPAPQASLLLCQALLARARRNPMHAAAMFEAAASAWAALPRPYDALLAREHQCTCLLAAGEREQALAELSQVFAGLVALGARRDADRVNQVLREHGVQMGPSPRRGRPGYGDELSPREWRIVDLIVEGQTNRHIADTLQLSVHTVGNHVRSAMRKLGVSTRTALATRASQVRGRPPEQL